jgi:hypothetical protein
MGVITGRPRNSTVILLVPDGGAPVNVSVVPEVVYVLGFCVTPDTETIIALVPAGA